MKTEEVLNRAGGLPQVVSPALQELAPVSFAFLDSRRKPVPFSSAGYVLRSGAKYYLRVVFAEDQDLQTVQLAAPPEFIRPHPATSQLDNKGNRVYEIQFRVERGLRSVDIEAEDLDLEFCYAAESGKPLQQLRVPIVIRPGIRFLLLSAVTALLAFWVPVWINDAGIKAEDAANLSKYQSLMYSPLPWVLAGVVFILVTALYVYVFFQLRARAYELWRDFKAYAEVPVSPEETEDG